MRLADEHDAGVREKPEKEKPDPGQIFVETESGQPLADQLARAASRSGLKPVLGLGQKSIDKYSLEDLVALILWIESDGLLRTKIELRDEAVRELGFKRRGPKIVAAIESAIDAARL